MVAMKTLGYTQFQQSRSSTTLKNMTIRLKKKDPEKELSKIPRIITGQKLVWGKSLIVNRILEPKF